MKVVYILCGALAFMLAASCTSHNNKQSSGTKNDTAYTIYKKDSTAIEVNVTNGDTTMEEMELNHMLIPIKR